MSSPEMSDSPPISKNPLQDQEPRALIGVCGVTGAGKTVFLTCVYQSIDTVIPDQGILTFDRKEIGGANYFENVEAQIRETGRTSATREEARARLLLKIDDPTSNLRGRRLPIDLFDFAGRYFTSLADLKALLSHDLPPEEHAAALRVNEYFENCHGLIVLVSSRLFDDRRDLPSENPFPKSLTYLIEDCRRRKRPLALVFSQADANPGLTEEVISGFERVRRFRRQFTSDLQEALQGEKPFGIVRLLSCYTLDASNRVARQSADGSIWKPEASQVFLTILKAAWPSIRRDLESAEAQRREQAVARPARKKRRRTGRLGILALLVASVALLAAGSGPLIRHWTERQESAATVATIRQLASQIEDGRLATITPEQLASLQVAVRAGAGSGGVVDAAFADLWRALGPQVAQLIKAPSLKPAYTVDLEHLLALQPALDASRPPWWSEQLRSTVASRLDLLHAWQSTAPSDHAERIGLIEAHLSRFQAADDAPFVTLLEETAATENAARIAAWDRELELMGSLGSRLRKMQVLLAGASQSPGGEIDLLSRKRLARRFIATILTLEENPDTRRALAKLQLTGTRISEDPLRFHSIYQELQTFDSLADYRGLKSQLEPIILSTEAGSQDRRALAETVLNGLLQTSSARHQHEVWWEVIDELRERYLFTISPEAHAGGFTPLPDRLAERLASMSSSSPPDRSLIDALLGRPIYDLELRALQFLISTRYARYKVVAVCRDLLKRLQADSFPYTPLPARPLERLREELIAMPKAEENLAKTSKEYFKIQEQQISELLDRIASFNDNPRRRLRDDVEALLHRQLSAQCGNALPTGTGDCVGVVVRTSVR